MVDIILHENADQLHYSPGSEVKGELSVSVDEPKHYKKIVVKLLGRADVCWSQEEGSGDSREQVTYSNKVTYIKQESVVWSKEMFGDTDLPVGKHTFPFQYQLPQNIPRSFEGRYGKVKYEILAKLSREGLLKHNHKASSTLTVREDTDLLGPCMEPITFDKDTRVQFLCCFNVGSISMRCGMPRTGFSPGDALPISVHIENQTTRMVHIHASVHKKDTFIASNGTRNIFSKQLRSIVSPRIQPGEVTLFESSSLQIPPEVIETFSSCSCISVEYTLCVKVIVSFGTNVVLKIPVVIAISQEKNGFR